MTDTFSYMRLGRTLAFLSCWLLASFAVAQAIPDAGVDATLVEPFAEATLVEPFVSDTTFLIMKVEPNLLNFPDLAGAIDTLPPEAVAGYRTLAEKFAAGKKQLTTLLDSSPIYGTAGIPISKTRVPVSLFVAKKSQQHGAKLLEFVNQLGVLKAEDRDGFIIATPAEVQPSEFPFPRSSAHSRDVIARAFQSVTDNPAKLLIIPPQHVWRTVRELSPELPEQLGGLPSSLLTDGVHWVAIGFDLARFRIEVVVQSASPDAAKTFAEELPRMLKLAHAAAPEDFRKRTAAVAQPMFSSLKPVVEGDRVKIVVDGVAEVKNNVELLATVARAVGHHRQRADDQQRLRQILLGMHNYYDVYKAFPPAKRHRDENAKPLLSWRVHILPFVGEQVLYNEFHLDEPWNSEHNLKLIEKMPDVYASDASAVAQDALPAGRTTTLAPVGEGTIFGQDKATQFLHVIDGTSNTVAVLIVDPERAVPWTAPRDFQFDSNDPLKGVRIGDDAQWHCAFADGSTHVLPADINAETVLRLFQMNDRNVVNIPGRR